MVRLATGQQMATFMKSKGVNFPKLTKAQIRDGNGGVVLDTLTDTQRAKVLKDTPLWFYVLREAELNDGQLRGVGARIVAETLHRAMEGSTASIVRDPRSGRRSGPNNTTFRMADLLFFAFEGKKTLLAPRRLNAADRGIRGAAGRGARGRLPGCPATACRRARPAGPRTRAARSRARRRRRRCRRRRPRR